MYMRCSQHEPRNGPLSPTTPERIKCEVTVAALGFQLAPAARAGGGLVDGMRDASGQMYMRNRYYDPQTGQFTQMDPIGLAGGLNSYGFAAGDPVTYSDPYGLCPIPPTNCVDVGMAVFSVGKFLAAPSLGTGAAALADVAGALPGVPSVGVLRRVVGGADEAAAVVRVSRSRFPEAARHIDDAQAAGHPAELTIDRAGAAARRRQAVGGTPRRSGADRDEYPPAMTKEGGAGSSVRHIPPADNRGAGACVGAQCRGLPNGTRIRVETSPEE